MESNATFSSSQGLVVAANGDIYVPDFGSSLIRKISPLGAVSTLAGNLASGSVDGV